jgi:LmbE family N-acetylglucosaminyl deacetylase
MDKKSILIVAAHPDDEILGCGGTVARLVHSGWEGHVLVLGEGVTSRDPQRDQARRADEIDRLRQQMISANRIIGVSDVTAKDLPDNRFDTVPFLDIVKIIEEERERVRPSMIFTHYEKDLNIDHRITHRATLTAARPHTDQTLREIHSYYIPSSSEWNPPHVFTPDVFFDISETVEQKITALKEYRQEMRPHPHPRSLDHVRLLARYYGVIAGLEYSEPMKSIRVLR